METFNNLKPVNSNDLKKLKDLNILYHKAYDNYTDLNEIYKGDTSEKNIKLKDTALKDALYLKNKIKDLIRDIAKNTNFNELINLKYKRMENIKGNWKSIAYKNMAVGDIIIGDNYKIYIIASIDKPISKTRCVFYVYNSTNNDFNNIIVNTNRQDYYKFFG